MLVTLNDLLLPAQKSGYAVGAFNTPNLESVMAVIAAAEELKTPVILSHAELHESLMPLDVIGPVMLAAAKRARVPVCVHLDHGVSYGLLVRAMRLGFTSVMYDGSVLPVEENTVNTAEIVKIAHALGVSVEAELGRILRPETGASGGGPEEESPESCYTDPDAAAGFVARTGVDALAIAFGTAHGIYTVKPKLDFDRITRVREKVAAPLVMHGGSGVSPEGFRQAIANGIAKINYYTYMSAAGGEAVRQAAKSTEEHLFYHDIASAAAEAMKQDAMRAMKVFGARKN